MGFENWLDVDPSHSDPTQLLKAIREARLERQRRWFPHVVPLLVADDRDFESRWRMTPRYPLNVLFEWVFLSGLVLFGFWPWLRRLKPWRWAVHIGLLPILLLMPAFLGYATFTFTSAGPTGGVLYPWLVVWFRSTQRGWLLGATNPITPLSTFLDTFVWYVLPKPLTTISQPFGPSISLSGGAGGLPGTVFWMGLYLGAFVYIVRRILERRQRGSERQRFSLKERLRLVAFNVVGIAVLLPIFTCFSLCRKQALFGAVYANKPRVVRCALSMRPALVNSENMEGYTPLHRAAQFGHLEIMDMLLERGADVNRQDVLGATALHYASWSSNEALMPRLLQAGARLNISDNLGMTPLHWAAARSWSADVLLARGADVRARNRDAQTPLHLAHSPVAASQLIAARADVSARDRWGDTPLHKRSCEGRPETLQVLLDHGVDVNAVSYDGMTPLHAAAKIGNTAALRVLLEKGADVNARTNSGLTPYGISHQHNEETRAILVEFGAKASE
jgi:ankyrin repeat protein